VNNENLEQNTKSSNNKKLIIVLIVLMIAIVSVGGVFTALSLKNKDNNKTEIKEENNTEVKEENKKEEVEEEQENESKTEEQQEEEKVISMDDYFLSYNPTFTSEDAIKLISSTDHYKLSLLFFGDMYKTNLSNEFKLYYTLNYYTIAALDNLIVDMYNENLEVKITTIEKIVKNIFVDFEMPSNLDKEKWYVGLYNLSCDAEKCNYLITTAGDPAPFTTGYISKPEINGNVITVKPIYVTYEISKEQINEEELELDVTLYDTETIQPFKTVKNYIPKDGSTEFEYVANNYDALVGYYETLETYKYTFTDDFKLISVEKE
jgi:hypothetical protein